MNEATRKVTVTFGKSGGERGEDSVVATATQEYPISQSLSEIAGLAVSEADGVYDDDNAVIRADGGIVYTWTYDADEEIEYFMSFVEA